MIFGLTCFIISSLCVYMCIRASERPLTDIYIKCPFYFSLTLYPLQAEIERLVSEKENISA